MDFIKHDMNHPAVVNFTKLTSFLNGFDSQKYYLTLLMYSEATKRNYFTRELLDEVSGFTGETCGDGFKILDHRSNMLLILMVGAGLLSLLPGCGAFRVVLPSEIDS